MEMLRLPGLVDAHVHLREPGATHKEDALSGTSAALAGGFCAVLDMPNNAPPITSEAALEAKRALFAGKAVCDYGLFVGYQGGSVEGLPCLAKRSVGLKLYLDQTFGDLTLDDPAALEPVFEAWPSDRPIAIHGESPCIALALDLALRYGQRLHVCHVPHPDDLWVIDGARQAGANVTCEVTPHHLFLSTRDATRLGSYGQMKPPLCAPDDVSRYWERLDLVDLIASDHAPHTKQEKASAQPPPGVPGLETTLPLLLQAVDAGLLALERMTDLLHFAPLAAYGLRPSEGCEIEVEIGDPYYLPFDGYTTRCGWSPFVGQKALGRVTRVRLRDQLVWELGRALARPGSGRDVSIT